MGSRFIAYLACERLVVVEPNALAKLIEQIFPSVPLKARAVLDAPPSLVGDGLLLDFGGSIVSVVAVDGPLPEDAYARALGLDRVWPAARETMASHRAHVIVATLAETNSHLEALNGAVQVSLATAALATLGQGVAIVWVNGDAITKPDQFIDAVRTLSRRQVRPDIWIGFDWLDGPPLSNGQRTLALVTTGLAPFIGREIEWLPAALSPATIAQRVLDLCRYLIVSGPVLKDGDTFGIDSQERIRARFVKRGQRGGPVVQLTMERGAKQLDGQRQAMVERALQANSIVRKRAFQ